jgi:hypothetical protein
VTPRIFQTGGAGEASLELVAELGGPVLAQWSWSEATSGPSCLDLPGQLVDLRTERPRMWLVLRAIGGSASLDKTTLWPR